MKRIAIVTLYFYNNFGSVLQAFALRKTLQRLSNGVVEILPYRPCVPEYEYFQDIPLKQQYKEKCRKFQAFRRTHLGMELEVDGNLCKKGNLAKRLESYDACVAGSDIIWGREFSGLDPIYFLKQAGEGTKKIAYAASVLLDGQGNTEDDKLFAECLPDFDFLSVRESSALPHIQRFTHKRAEAVLDPTLLLDAADYGELELENKEMHQEPYLLSYFLTHDPAAVAYTNLLAQKMGLRVIHYFADYPGRVFPENAGCFAFAGPGEFLGYIKNAACIFTNSFHGTCFASIYHKPFYTYTAKRAMISRVNDMAQSLGLESHFFTDFRDIGKEGDMECAQFGQNLQAGRETSLNFLRKAVGT